MHGKIGNTSNITGYRFQILENGFIPLLPKMFDIAHVQKNNWKEMEINGSSVDSNIFQFSINIFAELQINLL